MKVELRWLDREVQNLHPATNGWPREKVLQYRQLEAVVDASGAFSAIDNTWSKWQDVPTIKDD